MTYFTERVSRIEAHRWDGTVACMQRLRNWFDGKADCPPGPNMVASTPERDSMSLSDGTKMPVGAWLVKNVQGDFWTMLHEDHEQYFEEWRDVDVS